MTEYEFLEEMSENLRKMMKRRDISQTMLAKMTGIDRTSINRYSKGVSAPSLRNLTNICWALECDLDDIIVAWDYID